MRISDWSSDVCSSDLEARSEVAASPASGSGSAGSACLATEWSWVRRGLAPAAKTADPDRKSVVEGKGGSVRVDLGRRRIIKNKTCAIHLQLICQNTQNLLL